MILHGYIDESYNSRFFTLSCLLGRPKDWMWFESEWKKVLRQKNQKLKHEGRKEITRYHAADCSSRKGEFEGWAIDEQIEFAKRLLAIFNKYMTSVVAYTLPIADFKAIFPENANDLFPAMYRMLTNFLMNQTVHEIRTQAGSQAIDRVSIALIHDRSPYDHSYLAAFNFCKNDATFEGRHIFKSITPLGWEDCIPLQAADMLAYETFKDVENKASGRNRRKSLTSILEGTKFGGRSKFFTRRTLKFLRDTIEADAAGLPRPKRSSIDV